MTFQFERTTVERRAKKEKYITVLIRNESRQSTPRGSVFQIDPQVESRKTIKLTPNATNIDNTEEKN